MEQNIYSFEMTFYTENKDKTLDCSHLSKDQIETIKELANQYIDHNKCQEINMFIDTCRDINGTWTFIIFHNKDKEPIQTYDIYWEPYIPETRWEPAEGGYFDGAYYEIEEYLYDFTSHIPEEITWEIEDYEWDDPEHME